MLYSPRAHVTITGRPGWDRALPGVVVTSVNDPASCRSCHCAPPTPDHAGDGLLCCPGPWYSVAFTCPDCQVVHVNAFPEHDLRSDVPERVGHFPAPPGWTLYRLDAEDGDRAEPIVGWTVYGDGTARPAIAYRQDGEDVAVICDADDGPCFIVPPAPEPTPGEQAPRGDRR